MLETRTCECNTSNLDKCIIWHTKTNELYTQETFLNFTVTILRGMNS